MSESHNMPQTDIEVHMRTYHRFMLAVKWFSIHLAALMTFLTLWFATPVGFGWGLIVGLVIFGVGAWAMSRGPNSSTESPP